MAERDKLDREFTRRSLILSGGGVTLFGALGARLYYLQVIKGEDYTALSLDNQFNYRVLVPERGRILDRNGIALATNRLDYRVEIVPERVDDLRGVLNRLSQHTEISEEKKDELVNDARRQRGFIPVLVEDHLSWETFASINMDLPNLPGVVPSAGTARRYPESGYFSHILGYVGKPDPDDIGDSKDPLLRQPTFKIGKIGVEEAADSDLRGDAGRLKIEVNALGRVVREWPEKEDQAKPGKDVYLTIDSELQAKTAEMFGEESGGATLIDVMTGELRVLLSMPTFDSNLFVSGLTQADMDRMNSDERRPQYNKVIGGGYPPASTFKMIVALAGLEAGLINPKRKVFCSGKRPLGSRTFHCWERRGHGWMDMHDAIKRSCDVYFYELADRLGIDAVKNMAQRFGLGQRYDLSIKGQTAGILPDDEWKRGRLNDAWRTGDSYNAFIGQGFVLATPLQLGVMAARMANPTRAVEPSLLISQSTTTPPPVNINPDHMRLVQQTMWAVCEEPGGTAYRPGAMGIAGVQMAGKTGTGQVRGISAAERAQRVRRNEELPWKFRDHSIFVGYAPFDNPRFAASCIVEHGGSGARKAADLVRFMLKEALARDGLAEQRAAEAEG